MGERERENRKKWRGKKRTYKAIVKLVLLIVNVKKKKEVEERGEKECLVNIPKTGN